MGKYRKAVFVVTYSKTKEGIEYVLLKRKKHWRGWEFVKGGVDKGETLLKTAKREVKEETGLKPLKIKRFRVSGKYKYKKKVPERPNVLGQDYVLFSAEVKKGKIKLDKEHKEHSKAKWVDYKTAKKELTWNNQRKCLKIVDDYLKRK